MSRGDNRTPVIRDAVEFVTEFIDDGRVPWIATRAQILSSAYYVYPVRMAHHGIYTDSVHIMYIRPADKMVFIAAVKI